MVALASHTLRLATSAIFKTSEALEDEVEVALEGEECQQVSKSDPLTIPNAGAKIDPTSLAFSAMSLDTLATSSAASSMVTTNSESDRPNSNNMPVISMAEVRDHFMPNDGWMVLYDKVYDVTNFLDLVGFTHNLQLRGPSNNFLVYLQHPGGNFVMEDYLGHDATTAFRSVGHSTDALPMLDRYLIGVLPSNERLYDNKLRW